MKNKTNKKQKNNIYLPFKQNKNLVIKYTQVIVNKKKKKKKLIKIK